MYAQWVRTHTQAGSNFLFSDGSAHQVVSDLSTFIAKEDGHRVLVAGDMNILRSYGEYGSGYWAARYKTVFVRMESMRLPCIGPEYPNGRQADPWPDELPQESKNVPTFHHSRQSPETATRRLDHVFASTGLARSLKVRALNTPEDGDLATTAGSRLNLRKELDVAARTPLASCGGGRVSASPDGATYKHYREGNTTRQVSAP